MIKIILDTNFCLVPFEFKVDIFSEFERIINEKFVVIIPTVCIKELETKKNGEVAIALLKAKKVKIVSAPESKTVDDSIIKLALQTEGIIATQDKELKQKAKKLNIGIITLRQKKYLIIT